MTKEEKLRVYAAYLPYGLTGKSLEYDSIDKLLGIYGTGGHTLTLCHRLTGNNSVDYECNADEFTPVLYPLEYLTKEIEGKVNVINEIADLISPENSFSIIQNEDAIMLDFDEAFSTHTINFNYMMHQSYEVIQILLKYHFNVFQLPEDQFINKATLTQK